MTYLHGYETDEATPDVTVSDIDSSTIVLHGTAPKGPINKLTRVSTPTEALIFGSKLDGFTIPAALEQIFAEGNTAVYVVNTYDPATAVGNAAPAVGTATLVISGTAVNEVLATATQAVVSPGTVGDPFVIDVATGGGTWVTIGTGTISGTSNNTNNASQFKNAVNANTTAGLNTGFTANSAGSSLVVTVPAGRGATANTYLLRITLPGTSSGFATASNPVNFTGGVTASLTPNVGDSARITVGTTNYEYVVQNGNGYQTVINTLLSKLNANAQNFLATVAVTNSGGNHTAVYTLTGASGTSMNSLAVATSFPVNTGSSFSGAAATNFSGGAAGCIITDEPHFVSGRKVKTNINPISPVVVKSSNGSVTYVAGADYTANDFGGITILNPAIADGALLKLSYTWGDTSVVTGADIIGTIDGNNVRTGMKLMDLMRTKFNVKPKLICIPVYNILDEVRTEMLAAESKFRAFGFYTFAKGTTLVDAIAARGDGGSLPLSVVRGYAQYMWRKYYHADLNDDVLYDPTPALCGLIASIDAKRFDANEGYWTSPSNHEYAGGQGVEFEISFDPTDRTSDANQLNAVGIGTCVSDYGVPQKQWGNRNMSFPANSGAMTFINVRRVIDVLEESLEATISKNFADVTMTPAQISYIVSVANDYVRDLISKKVLLQGSKVSFDPAINNTTDMGNGIYRFSLDHMEYTPAELIIMTSRQNTALLNNLIATA